jgi:high-affinity iron transporter
MCTIFARESLEGSVIVGQYRTAIIRGYEPVEDGPTKEQLLRATTVSAAFATILAVIVVIIVAIPLAVLSNDLDERVVQIIEGASKVVAAACVLQLTLKIPKWFGYYLSRKRDGKIEESFDMTLRSIRFNIVWNLWREVAECGVFLLPSLLSGDNIKAIPLSAFSGIVAGLALGIIIYISNQRLKNKIYLTVFMTLVLVFLSTGLFVGGLHEFEETHETKQVWEIKGEFWNHENLPMAAVKPFGYSSDRTVLQVSAFWSWLAITAMLHGFMMWRTKIIKREIAAMEALEVANKNLSLDDTVDKESPVTSEADEEAIRNEEGLRNE